MKNQAFVTFLLAACATTSGAANVSNATQNQQMVPIPLASHPQGNAMMGQAVNNLLLDVSYKFLDKEYEKDVYVREPVTGKKVRTSCVRFKSNSGFRFAMDKPQYSLTTQGLTVTQNIAKIRADGLTFRFMLGPCAWTGAGLGLQLTDVKFVYKAHPMISFDGQGACRLSWNSETNSLNVAIGDLNIIGVQNNLDKLAKDAAREAINAALDGAFSPGLRGELQKVVINTCGSSKKGG